MSCDDAFNSGFTVGIALEAAGWHPAAWRETDAQPGEFFHASYWQALVANAEAAGIDYVTIEDALHLRSHDPLQCEVPPRAQANVVEGRLDALLIASWVAAHTERIGIIPTVTTTHTEPFHVATGLQTLDHISLGRAGWQVRFSTSAADAATVGRRSAPAFDFDAFSVGSEGSGINEVLEDTADVLEVARRLWDSWEDDAIIRDVASGRFLDAEKLHHIEFVGQRFRVKGPSIVPRSPQGQLPVAMLAHSRPTLQLAAQIADVIFITPESGANAKNADGNKTVSQLIAEIRAVEKAQRRSERGFSPLRIVADLAVILDSPFESGRERLRRLNGLIAVPYRSDARIAAGSVAEIADLIACWRAQGIDGVRVRPLTLPHDGEVIRQELLPLLRERGLLEPPQQRIRPLRETFGLAVAANRYSATRTKEALA